METVVYNPYEQIDVSAFLPDIMYNASTAKDTLDSGAACSSVLSTVIDIARRTKSIKRAVQLKLIPCVSTYKLKVPGCVTPLAVLKACSEDGPLRVIPHAPCSERVISRLWGVSVEDDIVFVYDVPKDSDYTGTIDLTVAVAPKKDACEVDKFIYETFSNVVTAGVLSKVFANASASWHNASLADFWMKEYSKRIASMGCDRVLGLAYGPFKLRGMGLFGRRDGGM